MDPRHKPEYKRAKRKAASDAKEEARAARVRQKHSELIRVVEGAYCSEMIQASENASSLSLIRAYLFKGLPLSAEAREIVEKRVRDGRIEDDDLMTLQEDMLKGAVGLLKGWSKEQAYRLLVGRTGMMSFITRVGLTRNLLDEALGIWVPLWRKD
jgi:hypothetical protein